MKFPFLVYFFSIYQEYSGWSDVTKLGWFIVYSTIYTEAVSNEYPLSEFGLL